MHKARIIGVSGHANSGKDTIAEHLIYEHGFVRVALADPIKRFAYHVFEFSRQQLWGPSASRNKVDHRYYADSEAWNLALANLTSKGPAFVAEVLNTADEEKLSSSYKTLVNWFFWLRVEHPNLSPRIMLQTLGTEWGRKYVDPDIWVNALLRTAKLLLHEDGNTTLWSYDPLLGPVSTERSSLRGVVISDIRFENELVAIQREGGSIIRVIRPETDSDAKNLGIVGHESEVQEFSLDNVNFLVQNDKSLSDLYSSIDLFLQAMFSDF
jgi:hypothetical protein